MERRDGRATGPGQGGQNEKTPLPDPRGANEVGDVFVVGGATAVGYLWVLHSEICAKDQTIAAIGSSYRGMQSPVGAAEGCDLLILIQPNNSLMAIICSAT